MKKILLTLLLSSFATIAMAAKSQITIEKPYIRLLPPTAKNTAAFMVIKNDSNKDVSLTKVEGDIAMAIELHTHMNEGGKMRMREVDSILVKKKSSTALEPGSFHVMIMGLKKPLKKDQKVRMTFHFSDNSKKLMILPVKKEGDEHSHHDHKHETHHHH